MDAILVPAFTFAFVAVAAGAALSWVVDRAVGDRKKINERLAAEFPAMLRGAARKTSLFKELGASASPGQELWVVRMVARARTIVEQSGTPISLGGLTIVSLAVGVLAGAATGWFTDGWPTVVIAGLLIAALPGFCVILRRRARIERLRGQLPEAFELMSSAVRAGQTLPEALRMVASEMSAPLADEFAYCAQQQDLGLPFDVSLRELGRRTGVVELQIFIVALLVQRQTGSNPAEILDNLAEVVRKRFRLMGKIKAFTGEGRMQAVVLCLLPVAAFVALSFVNPAYAQVLIDRPRLLCACVVSELIGVLWIRNIIRLDS